MVGEIDVDKTPEDNDGLNVGVYVGWNDGSGVGVLVSETIDGATLEIEIV